MLREPRRKLPWNQAALGILPLRPARVTGPLFAGMVMGAASNDVQRCSQCLHSAIWMISDSITSSRMTSTLPQTEQVGPSTLWGVPLCMLSTSFVTFEPRMIDLGFRAPGGSSRMGLLGHSLSLVMGFLRSDLPISVLFPFCLRSALSVGFYLLLFSVSCFSVFCQFPTPARFGLSSDSRGFPNLSAISFKPFRPLDPHPLPLFVLASLWPVLLPAPSGSNRIYRNASTDGRRSWGLFHRVTPLSDSSRCHSRLSPRPRSTTSLGSHTVFRQSLHAVTQSHSRISRGRILYELVLVCTIYLLHDLVLRSYSPLSAVQISTLRVSMVRGPCHLRPCHLRPCHLWPCHLWPPAIQFSMTACGPQRFAVFGYFPSFHRPSRHLRLSIASRVFRSTDTRKNRRPRQPKLIQPPPL